VRPATAADAQAIAAVHVASWRAAYAGLLPDELLARLDADARARQWRERLAGLGAGAFVLVFEHLGQVRGFVSGGPDRHGSADGEVYAIYVDPDWQGRGAGTRLLTAASRRLAEARFCQASLWVLVGNDPAVGFYESRGWRFDGTEQPWAFEGGTHPEARYVISLAARPA
jgi:ribosomal protein S18 acetylase RimI-like enzyme